MRTALAISPHLDDAVFSAGGTLAWLAQQGWQVVVATVFTATVPNPTGFALRCQTDKGLSPEVDYMAVRRAEDRAAGAALNARMLHLPLREAPHRGYESAAALFNPPHHADSLQPVIEALQTLVATWQPDLILAPQAFGGHVDHVLTVQALQTLSLSAPVLWWQDFPYLRRADTPRRPFADSLERLPERQPLTDFASKHRACLAYATQLGFQFGGSEGLASALAETNGIERMRLQGHAPFLATAA